ncbi:hypothetical protein, partial [Tannerella forsythia]|uniref:hypothetical protein n=1 Tax=Tannerella forsythia TaxID=28112 RepID=UPI0028ED2619
ERKHTLKRTCVIQILQMVTDGKFAKSNPFHFKITRKRLISNHFKERLTRFNGTAMKRTI